MFHTSVGDLRNFVTTEAIPEPESAKGLCTCREESKILTSDAQRGRGQTAMLVIEKRPVDNQYTHQ